MFWKEYRQHRALCLAFILMAFAMQTFCFLVCFQDTNISDAPYYTALGIFFTVLYAGAASAMLFANEREERTDAFLGRLPVSGATVLGAKLGWFLCGLLVVLVGIGAVSCVWLLLDPKYFQCWFGSQAAGHMEGDFMEGDIIVSFLVMTLQLSVWGLFWSPRLNAALHALLLTFACFMAEMYLIKLIGEHYRMAALPTDLILSICSAVLLPFALWGGACWLRARDSKARPRRRDPGAAIGATTGAT
ncbi:MAG TPA: hypothetical protein DEB39_11080, partial [Planctomycetaceae bacterium]|nr:hypothetical protein [Planctomycetaceae bacterium]